MANYLERVAFSAARKAAVAKPPSSGPPLMPAGREFIPSGQEMFAADEDELSGASAPEKPAQSRAADAIPSVGPTVEAEPAPRPATMPVSLKNEAPFTVHLPKTLRPISAEKVPPSVPEAPTSERVVVTEPSPIVERSEQVVQFVEPEVRETAATPVRSDVKSEPAVKEIYEKTVVAEPQPLAPRVREVVRNKIISTTSASEPVPTAQPRQAPAVVVGSSANRPEPSRISIGQFEVLVNNQLPTAPPKPAAVAPAQSNSNHLERRYLDRFRLRR